jgi:uncharacterized protein YegJ (DUF2314 family)
MGGTSTGFTKSWHRCRLAVSHFSGWSRVKMNRKPRIVMVLVAALLTSLPACSQRDKVVGVAEDDPEMTAAISEARATLPKFWQIFEKRERGETDFALKVRITDKKGVEHFWVIDIERRDGKTMGTINNDPDTVASVKLGDRLEIPEGDISDWLYRRDGKMVGNRTLKALFKQMPPAEVERLKKILADP